MFLIPSFSEEDDISTISVRKILTGIKHETWTRLRHNRTNFGLKVGSRMVNPQQKSSSLAFCDSHVVVNVGMFALQACVGGQKQVQNHKPAGFKDGCCLQGVRNSSLALFC